MQDLVMTPGTVAALAVIVAWAVWAVRRMTTRGLCDCGDHCGDTSCSSSRCSACACGCGAADKMVADMAKSLK